MVASDFADRPIKKLVLFDVDYTLTYPRYDRPRDSLSQAVKHHLQTESLCGDDQIPRRAQTKGGHRICRRL